MDRPERPPCDWPEIVLDAVACAAVAFAAGTYRGFAIQLLLLAGAGAAAFVVQMLRSLSQGAIHAILGAGCGAMMSIGCDAPPQDGVPWGAAIGFATSLLPRCVRHFILAFVAELSLFGGLPYAWHRGADRWLAPLGAGIWMPLLLLPTVAALTSARLAPSDSSPSAADPPD